LSLLIPSLTLYAVSGCRPSSPPPAPSVSPTSLAALQAKVHREPGNPVTRLELAEEYARQGETYAAIEQMQLAYDAGSRDKATAMRLAERYNAVGETEEAEAILAAAAKEAASSSTDVALALSQ